MNISQRRATLGFSLLELVIVLALVALLLVVGLPLYEQQLMKGRRTLAAAHLQTLLTLQQEFFLQHRRYAANFESLGVAPGPYAINARGDVVAPAAATRRYSIEMVVRPDGFTVTARPRLAQSRDHACGNLSLDSNGARRVSGAALASACW